MQYTSTSVHLTEGTAPLPAQQGSPIMPSHQITPEIVGLLSPQLLADARSDTARAWTARALCVGADPKLFFPPGDGPAAEARQMCETCPVRGQCLAYAVTADERFGIWGGLDPHERHSLCRHLQRKASPATSHAGSAA